jgi:hypothetical protein
LVEAIEKSRDNAKDLLRQRENAEVMQRNLLRQCENAEQMQRFSMR